MVFNKYGTNFNKFGTSYTRVASLKSEKTRRASTTVGLEIIESEEVRSPRKPREEYVQHLDAREDYIVLENDMLVSMCLLTTIPAVEACPMVFRGLKPVPCIQDSYLRTWEPHWGLPSLVGRPWPISSPTTIYFRRKSLSSH